MDFKIDDKVVAIYSPDHMGTVTKVDGKGYVTWTCERCDIEVVDFPSELTHIKGDGVDGTRSRL